MKRVTIILLLIVTIAGFGQNTIGFDSVKISFIFPNSVVADSNNLKLKVVYKNNTDKEIPIYQYLEEGYKGDRFFNINIEMEKLNQEKYILHPMRFYKNANLHRLEDSLRHFDLPQKKLPPFASDTLELSLLKVARGFLPGKYRFKAYLRVKTIRDEREYNDTNFETLPPKDEIKYIASKWFYFVVKEEIKMRLPVESD